MNVKRKLLAINERMMINDVDKLWKNGWSNYEIAAHLHQPIEKVNNWLAKIFEDDIFNV